MSVNLRPTASTSEMAALGSSRWVQLDRAMNPFGACPAAVEVLENGDDTAETGTAALRLRERLRDRYRVPWESVALSRGPDTTIAGLLRAIPGPVVSLSSSVAGPMGDLSHLGAKVIGVARGAGRSGPRIPRQ